MTHTPAQTLLQPPPAPAPYVTGVQPGGGPHLSENRGGPGSHEPTITKNTGADVHMSAGDYGWQDEKSSLRVGNGTHL